MKPPPTFEHGTYAGYNKHTRLGIPMCEECRRAATDYIRRWRAANPSYRTRNRLDTRRRSRAVQMAADWVRRYHPEKWAEFKAEATRETIS